MTSGLTTVPLQSPMNASPFWIMLLLSAGADERRMIDRERYPAKVPSVIVRRPRPRHLPSRHSVNRENKTPVSIRAFL
jgi:hypothetical protein